MNPFVGMSVGAWLVFLWALGVADFKPWAWMLWVPWLTFATLAPVVWWWRHRKPNAEAHGRRSRTAQPVVGASGSGD